MSVSKMVLLAPEKYKSLLENQVQTHDSKYLGNDLQGAGGDQRHSHVLSDSQTVKGQQVTDVKRVAHKPVKVGKIGERSKAGQLGEGARDLKEVQNNSSSSEYNNNTDLAKNSANIIPPPPGLPVNALQDIFSNWVEI